MTLLPPELSALGAQVARTAGDLSAAVDRCDREIATIARDASASEVERLEGQLAALQSAPGEEAEDRRELRRLVTTQLELVRRMHGRREAVAQRRAHLFHLMRGLWAQLALVRSAASPAVNERLRMLCEEIADEVTPAP